MKHRKVLRQFSLIVLYKILLVMLMKKPILKQLIKLF